MNTFFVNLINVALNSFYIQRNPPVAGCKNDEIEQNYEIYFPIIGSPDE